MTEQRLTYPIQYLQRPLRPSDQQALPEPYRAIVRRPPVDLDAEQFGHEVVDLQVREPGNDRDRVAFDRSEAARRASDLDGGGHRAVRDEDGMHGWLKNG